MKLSVVIPAHDEVDSVGATAANLAETLECESIDHEILVIDDASTDGTADAIERVAVEYPTVRVARSHYPPGFGLAVRAGLDLYAGDAVAIVMADGSDSAEDVVHYYRMLEYGFDCVFGSRFVRGATVRGYPWPKLIVNRFANFVVRVLFRHGYNDTTNAFKAYRREVIDGVQPLLAHHFNLTVELPLKAIVRGYSYAIVPISWTSRAAGRSKLVMKEMGSRYLFVVLYVFLEHHLSRGDYRRSEYAQRQRPARLTMPRTGRRRSRSADEQQPVEMAASRSAVPASREGESR